MPQQVPSTACGMPRQVCELGHSLLDRVHGACPPGRHHAWDDKPGFLNRPPDPDITERAGFASRRGIAASNPRGVAFGPARVRIPLWAQACLAEMCEATD